MKYDILLEFKKYLQDNLTPNTARTYYAAVNKLFRDIQFDSLAQIDRDWIMQSCREMFRTRNEFSVVKNGIKWLHKFDPAFQIPAEKEFREASKKNVIAARSHLKQFT